MSFEEMLAWIVAANTITSFSTTAYNLMSTRATKALSAIASLETKITKLAEDRQTASDQVTDRFRDVENRLLRIEADLEHVPDRDQWHNMDLSIRQLIGTMETLDTRLSGRIELLDERLKPVAATTARLQAYLIKQD